MGATNLCGIKKALAIRVKIELKATFNLEITAIARVIKTS